MTVVTTKVLMCDGENCQERYETTDNVTASALRRWAARLCNWTRGGTSKDYCPKCTEQTWKDKA